MLRAKRPQLSVSSLKLSLELDSKAAKVAAPGPQKSILFNEQPFIYRESKEAAGRARNLIKTLQVTAANEVRLTVLWGGWN